MTIYQRILKLLAILLAGTFHASGQDVKSTANTPIDTINIHGKVIDGNGIALAGANVISKTLNLGNNFKTATTDSRGYFVLEGIKPIDTLIFYYGMYDKVVRNNKSRYLLVEIIDHTRHFNMDSSLSISAKKRSPSPKFLAENIVQNPKYYFDRNYSPYPASYRGGMNKLYIYLKKNMIYPKAAIDNNIDGTISVEFTIDEFGLAKDFLVVRDIGYGCATEAIRVLKGMNKWTPAMNEGKHYPQRVSLEIPFRLVE